MATTFRDLIAANKRNSLLLVAVFVLFTTVVLARRYSRNSGATSDDKATMTSGNTSCNISPTRFSCDGFT